MSYELHEQSYQDKRAERGCSKTAKQQQREQALLDDHIELHFCSRRSRPSTTRSPRTGAMTRGAMPTRGPSQSPPRPCSWTPERTSSPSRVPHASRCEGAVSRRALEPHL
eukprot:9491866-Pyramimonas_sp.AAC.1